jgi:hypothetical protein
MTLQQLTALLLSICLVHGGLFAQQSAPPAKESSGGGEPTQPAAIPLQASGPSGTPQDLPSNTFRDRVVWIPYWSEKDSHRSILHLRNGLHHLPLAATIDILSQQGTLLATRTLTLRKLENVDLRLQSLLPATAREEDRAGSIRISYRYPYDSVLQAELSIRDGARNHAYTIVGRPSYTGSTKSAYLLLHRPTRESYLEMAFVNPTAQAASIRLMLRAGIGWKEIGRVDLRPLQTHKLRIEAETLTSAVLPAAPDAALVRAEYSLTSTEIIANAWLEDERTGFSNTALFHDEYPSSNALYATQLVSGGFPWSAIANSPRIDGVLTFVNVDSAPATLTPTLH